MEKFEICIAVGSDPDFFTGDSTSGEQFIRDRTSATKEEIAASMMKSWLFKKETIIARDGWVASIAWIKE